MFVLGDSNWVIVVAITRFSRSQARYSFFYSESLAVHKPWYFSQTRLFLYHYRQDCISMANIKDWTFHSHKSSELVAETLHARPSTYKKWTDETLRHACKAVNNGMSIRRASKNTKFLNQQFKIASMEKMLLTVRADLSNNCPLKKKQSSFNF